MYVPITSGNVGILFVLSDNSAKLAFSAISEARERKRERAQKGETR